MTAPLHVIPFQCREKYPTLIPSSMSLKLFAVLEGLVEAIEIRPKEILTVPLYIDIFCPSYFILRVCPGMRYGVLGHPLHALFSHKDHFFLHVFGLIFFFYGMLLLLRETKKGGGVNSDLLLSHCRCTVNERRRKRCGSQGTFGVHPRVSYVAIGLDIPQRYPPRWLIYSTVPPAI